MFDTLFATFLIGLREGLEATLIVSILVAYLVKSDKRKYLPHVWGGVAAAVVITVIAWAVQHYGTRELTPDGRELFEAITSILAVCFVTWMIFWMRKAARRIAGELRAKLEQAIKMGPVAVVTMAFLAVIREGLETAVILETQTTASQGGTEALLAAIVGIAVSVAIGVGIYYGAVKINLSRFFTWTGVLLIFVAAGIFKYGIHDFQEVGALPGLNTFAFDISGWYAQDSWYGNLLEGMFNITATPSVVETIAWVAYVVPALTFFLWPSGKKPAPAAAPKSEETASAS
ncbi:iron uptake transporter permease EfeU [Stackebrandtia nassauensis]|uniref:Iron permease FTR1 n=1 Tax=Stackebrandtia nassauensis (strain DSM 44728 / CIP 108903 / NRRL B-16338 / NBRC 102104 / LLR-40K-21) TaxID=446470 RepID=D3PXY7_STANL|nr:iron uptake transporter permease EfeU [Stackebrandtia nassauensis]ADD45316.1 iron permease FTR1 [Stackebrandtia nassauensis DSM 44728]